MEREKEMGGEGGREGRKGRKGREPISLYLKLLLAPCSMARLLFPPVNCTSKLLIG